MERYLQEQPDVIASFNTYPGAGNTENTKNHILFTFVNCPLTKRMNSFSANPGGYRASKLRAFLEGTNGNGAGDKSGVTIAAFMNALGDEEVYMPAITSSRGGGACLWVTAARFVFGGFK